jgi:hypothetical protein
VDNLDMMMMKHKECMQRPGFSGHLNHDSSLQIEPTGITISGEPLLQIARNLADLDLI